MSDHPEPTRRAVSEAYHAVLRGEAACDNVAFEAALMVFQRLHPDVPVDTARDDVSQIIGDGVATTAMGWASAVASGPK